MLKVVNNSQIITGGAVEKQRARRNAVLRAARRAMFPNTRLIDVRDAGRELRFRVTRLGVGPLTTSAGDVWMMKFDVSDRWREYTAIIKAARVGDDFIPHFDDHENLLLRVDSGCESGQLFHDLTCECQEQLHEAMYMIGMAGEGIIVHIRAQDGRGKQLPFKLATLYLQRELGVHTVEAANLLAGGDSIDDRDYAGAIAILKFLRCGPNFGFRVMTNNPKKLELFAENDFSIRPVHIAIQPTEHTHRHLAAKQEFLGHTKLIEE